jgi:hypothetical protein
VPGSSKYPKALDDLPEDKVSSTNAREGKPTSGPEGDHSGHHNALAAGINATQATLGTEPQGSEDTVADRLEEMDAAISLGLGELPPNVALLEAGKLKASQIPASVVSSSAPTVKQGLVYIEPGLWVSEAEGRWLGNGTKSDFENNPNVRNPEIDYMRAPGSALFIPNPRVQGRALFVKYFDPTSEDSQQANSTGVFLVDPLGGSQRYTAKPLVGNESDAVNQGWLVRGFGGRSIGHVVKSQTQLGTGSIAGALGVTDYQYGSFATSEGAHGVGTVVRQHAQYYAQDPLTGSTGLIGVRWGMYAENSIHSEDALTVGKVTGVEGSLNAAIEVGATSLTVEAGQGATAAQQAITGTTTLESTTITGLSSVAYPVVVGAFVSGKGLPLGTVIVSVNTGANSCEVSIPAGVISNSPGAPGTGTLTIGGGLKGGAFASTGTAQLDVGANAEVVTFTIVNDAVTLGAAVKNAHARYCRFAVLDSNGFGGWRMASGILTAVGGNSAVVSAGEMQSAAGLTINAQGGTGKVSHIKQTTPPGTPSASRLYEYANSAGQLAWKGSDGFEHVVSATPLEEILLTGLGFKSWAFDWGMTSGATAPTAGTIYLRAIPLRAGQKISKVDWITSQQGVGTAPTHIYTGYCDSTGKMLAQSADLGASSIWTAGALIVQAPLSAEWTVPADGIYYAVILQVGSWGTTQMTLAKGVSGAAAGGLGPLPYPTAGTAKTALPANGESLSTPLVTNGLNYWVGAS